MAKTYARYILEVDYDPETITAAQIDVLIRERLAETFSDQLGMHIGRIVG